MGARLKWAMALGFLTMAASAPSATAATINVDTVTDQFGTVGSECALREAVQAANDNTSFGGCNGDAAGADTIVLESGVIHDLTLQFTQENANVWGDLDIQSVVTITSDGPSMAFINGPALMGGDKDRVLHVEPASGGVTLRRIRIQNGQLTHPNTGIPGGGGAVYNQGSALSVIDSEIVNNKVIATAGTSVRGGGIYTDGGGSLAMSGSTVVGNTVTAAANTDAIGGGIMVYSPGSELAMTNSTVSGNSALPAPGNTWPGFAGGIFAGDNSANSPEVALTNVTVTLNSASGPGALVGGVQVGFDDSLSTFSGVLAAGNTDPSDTSPDCRGFPTSLGGNFIGDEGSSNGSCDDIALNQPTDLVGPDAAPIPSGLGGLADFGGPTRTHEVNPTSAALNRGGPCPATDQRGRFRFNVAPCDSGAFEAGASLTAPPVIVTPTTPVTPATPAATGQRAAALAKCKKKKSKKARKKCRAKAQKLPV